MYNNMYLYMHVFFFLKNGLVLKSDFRKPADLKVYQKNQK